MTNNDILRRIRYTFDFGDSQMLAIFAAADLEVSRSQLSDWLKKEEDPAHQEMSDQQLASFLNGYINHQRGKREGAQVAPEKRLNNNIVLRKLKIALNLQADDVLALINQGELNLSKHELSAFFRKHEHKHYRQCKDQVLRNFLNGMQEKYHS